MLYAPYEKCSDWGQAPIIRASAPSVVCSALGAKYWRMSIENITIIQIFP
jgi:hypothetical protein